MQDPDRPDPARVMFDADSASRALGMELTATGPGYARTRMRITENMVNGHDIAHGGYLFLLADTAFACACNSHGPTTVAARADITFMRPVSLGEELVATARERTRFGRSGIYDVTVARDGQTIAEFRGHSKSLDDERTGEESR